MTTITTGTSGPQAWKMILAGAAVGLATIAIVNLPQTSTDTTDPQATEVSQAVTAENPQTRSFFDENSATGQTPAQPDSVTGFEYGNESTTGQTASPGVTTQYSGNSGELFPYENGQAPAQAPTGFSGPVPLTQARIDLLAPVITQGFLDGPSSGVQGAQRVDPRAAAAAGLSPGAIDAVVGGTTQVASSPDNLADAQARASVDTQPQAQAFAASDEALVNPVAEVNAAQLIQDIIATERSAPAPAAPLAASDEALVRSVSEGTVGVAAEATNARWQALAEAYSETANNGTISSLYTGDPDPVTSIPANANAEAGTNARWGALHGAYHNGTLSSYTNPSNVSPSVSPEWNAYVEAVNNGTVAGLYAPAESDPFIVGRVDGDPYLGGTSDDSLVITSTEVNPADIKFVGTSTQAAGTERTPQQNVSIR